MIKQYCESSSNFSFEFGGDNEIYADTLAKTINSVLDTLQYITTKEDPEAYIKVKITSFRNGSFDIDLEAIVSYIPTLLTRENLSVAYSIIGMFLNVLLIKKHLHGKKPKNIEYQDGKCTITNADDEKMKIDEKSSKLYFENNIIDKNIVNIFNVIIEDGTRDNLTIKQDNETKIQIEQEGFKELATSIIEETDVQEHQVKVDVIQTNLELKKVDFTGNSQWEFVFLGKMIRATVEDENWLQKVHTGEISFCAGDKIPAKLRIEYELDKNNESIKNSYRYSVISVTGNVIRPKKHIQKSLLEE